MNRVEADKSRLREVFKKKKANLTNEEVKRKSRQIAKNFLTNLLPEIYKKNSGKIFSLYFAVNNEVLTDLISEHFLKNQISFSYPRITQKNQCLEFILAEKNQTFFPNQFYPKIFEPVSGKKIYPDLLILPLLAFDHQLSRLGMGGGFFDRSLAFLKSKKSKLAAIGLAYDFQRFEGILPVEVTDCGLDFIVTEKMIFSSVQQTLNLTEKKSSKNL